jgi:hypothetical protein
MPDLTMILIGILVLAILWVVLKFLFKLTMRIFSCGCVLILLVGAFIFLSSYLGFLNLTDVF